MVGVDLDLDLDLVNENFDVLGLRLDNLLSNSRICYCISFPLLPSCYGG